MTDLTRLKVSLTKHNAHKVARLLKEYDAAQVFDRLDEVHAEAAQARKNLSTLQGDLLPPVWGKVKALGDNAIDALVLIAIIFSHRELIEAMQSASGRQGFSGRIERANQLDGKAYTNFVQIIDSLGYATKREYEGVTFNLKGIFEIPGLAPLVRELLEMKLVEARWDRSNSVAEEAVRLKFHRVFGVASNELKDWLNADAQPPSAGSPLLPKDEEFFQEETEGSGAKPFEFKSGHVERDVEPLTRSPSAKSRANRLHNDIQNKLYAHLKGRLGAKNVGTELDTGGGTAIDVATQVKNQITFYEIKTGSSVRASIRQALPQLLEYAFWPQDRRANELVIVSHLPITKAADRYLEFLRTEFNLPISYRQFDLKTNSLL
ncbi:MAG: hypothetical protein H6917_04965 [Novosphingobium sp.]|nr:hypothetical protein [Novosphingobium sp.]MCP5401723.1 hypothetical protein [Novosphingobium sp.]